MILLLVLNLCTKHIFDNFKMSDAVQHRGEVILDVIKSDLSGCSRRLIWWSYVYGPKYIICAFTNSTPYWFFADIVPGGKYTQDDFEKALSLAVGHKVGVLCNRNSATGELQLYEAFICYSPDEKEVIDCGHNNLPSPVENECTGKIALPRKPCKPTSFGSCESDA